MSLFYKKILYTNNLADIFVGCVSVEMSKGSGDFLSFIWIQVSDYNEALDANV